jgi:hypothetical protein
MKIGGVDPKTLPKEEILVLPRGEQEIVFRAVGIPDYDEFDKLCPEPKPPGKLTKDGWEANEDDPDYKSVLANHNAKRLAWMAVKSLEPSEIEWDSVVPSKPSTWTNWQKDLKEAGFSQVECNRVMQLVFQANCLDEEKLKRAREVFLLGQQPAPSEFSGQSTEPENTPSGEPASA